MPPPTLQLLLTLHGPWSGPAVAWDVEHTVGANAGVCRQGRGAGAVGGNHHGVREAGAWRHWGDGAGDMA